MTILQNTARRYACMAVLGLAQLGITAAATVEDIPAGTWYEVPGSKLEAVKPVPEPPSWSGFSGLFAWAGGVLDTKRDRLLVWGGGHADYTGNEIYAFDLATLKWSRIWGPSKEIPASPESGKTQDTYADGNPSARHTYDNLVYNPARDVLFSSGGSLSWGGQWTEGTWEFSLANNAWQKRQNVNASTFNQSSYDLSSGLIFRTSESATEEFNPTTNVWTKRSSDGNTGDWQFSGEIDPDHHVMVLIGGGHLRVFNLKTYVMSTPTATGDTEILSAYAPGLTWDSKSHKLVAWSGGAAVYRIDIADNLSGYSIKKVAAAAGNKITPSEPNKQGTYSKFQYSPGKNVFVLVNQVDNSVYIYRLTEGGGVVDLKKGPTLPKGQSGFRLFRQLGDGSAARLLNGDAGMAASLEWFDMQGRHGAGLRNGQAGWPGKTFASGTYVLKASQEGKLHGKWIESD